MASLYLRNSLLWFVQFYFNTVLCHHFLCAIGYFDWYNGELRVEVACTHLNSIRRLITQFLCSPHVLTQCWLPLPILWDIVNRMKLFKFIFLHFQHKPYFFLRLALQCTNIDRKFVFVNYNYSTTTLFKILAFFSNTGAIHQWRNIMSSWISIQRWSELFTPPFREYTKKNNKYIFDCRNV